MNRIQWLSLAFLAGAVSSDVRAADITTENEWLERPGGVRLHQVRTRPAGAEGALPTVLFVQWVSCSSVIEDREDPNGWDDMMIGLLDRSGWQVIRTEKRGVGESSGSCAEMDYLTELDDHRAALAKLRQDPRVDQDKVVIYGASMGSTMAPLLAAEEAAAGRPVAGVIGWGGGALTWFERQFSFDRKAIELSGTPAAEINPQVAEHARFQLEYLVNGKPPAQVVAEFPELADVPPRVRGLGESDHYGRPYAYHWQAQQQNWAAAWAAIDAPALVMYGEYDWFETARGHELAARMANEAHPGSARYVLLERTNHHFFRYPTAELAFEDDEAEGENVAEEAVREILAFLEAVESDSKKVTAGT